MPDDHLEQLRMWCDGLCIHSRNDNHMVPDTGRKAAIPANNAENVRANDFGVFQRAHEFGLIFFSRLPPPTDMTNSASRDDKRLVRSHSTNVVSHPSSLVRAVSSETLSVGA